MSSIFVYFKNRPMLLKGIYVGKPAIFQLIVLLLLIMAGAVFSSLFAMGILHLAHVPYTDIGAISGHDACIAASFSYRDIPFSGIGTCLAMQQQSERIPVVRKSQTVRVVRERPLRTHVSQRLTALPHHQPDRLTEQTNGTAVFHGSSGKLDAGTRGSSREDDFDAIGRRRSDDPDF